MTAWHPTTPDWYTQTAERVCTPKQLEVLQLASHDLTDQQIADRIGITRQAVQQRRMSATFTIRTYAP
jgi:DNA-binding CsgD family transcriptional regulator